MTWDELLPNIGLDKEIVVTLINPVRKGEYFKQGTLCGFKSGIFGPKMKSGSGGYTISSPHVLKTPKVCVAYNIWEWGKKPYTDWVDANNCIFEIKEA